jgi:hypothetical protein
MAISQISSDMPAAQTAQTKQGTAAVATDQQTAQAAKTANTDKVTISKQAQQLAAQVYSPQEEAKEPQTQKNAETAQGKK